MPSFDPQTLADWSGGRWSSPTVGLRIDGFQNDSRALQPGELFVALKTAQRDGHDFVEKAALAGARAALVAREMPVAIPQLIVADPLFALQEMARRHRERFRGTVIGITGSCGKTSTKELLAHLLGPRCHKTRANLNNFLGVPLTLLGLDPVAHDFAVVEAGINEPGEMKRLGEMIRPDLAIVTMIGPAHIEKLGSLEGIAEEKSAIFQTRKPEDPVLFSVGCLEYAPFRRELPRAWVTARAHEVAADAESAFVRHAAVDSRLGTTLRIRSSLLDAEFTLAPVSAGMQSNAALAIAAATLAGASERDVRERLAGWSPGLHRAETRWIDGRFFYIDCYNANPASLRDALFAFDRQAPREPARLYVLGGMKELGADVARWHRQALQGLRFRNDDVFLLVGDEAEYFRPSLPEGATVYAQVDEAKARCLVEAFAGSVFLKGSRAYALERFIPQTKEVAC